MYVGCQSYKANEGQNNETYDIVSVKINENPSYGVLLHKVDSECVENVENSFTCQPNTTLCDSKSLTSHKLGSKTFDLRNETAVPLPPRSL